MRNRANYLALGVLPDGTLDALGLPIENTGGAKFWMMRGQGVACGDESVRNTLERFTAAAHAAR